jgi:anti-sigma B factor antagonist
MNVVSTEKEGVSIGEVDSRMLDASTVSAFRDAVKPLLTEKAQVVLDLSKVEFIDSSGLGALVACLRQAHAIGGDIKLFGLGKSARALFELVRMHRVFEVFNSADEAISSYRA